MQPAQHGGRISKRLLRTVARLVANAEAMGIELWGRAYGRVGQSGCIVGSGRKDEMLPPEWASPALPYGEAYSRHLLAGRGQNEEARQKLRRRFRPSAGSVDEDDWAEDLSLTGDCWRQLSWYERRESTALLYKRLEGAEDWYVFGSTRQRPPDGECRHGSEQAEDAREDTW